MFPNNNLADTVETTGSAEKKATPFTPEALFQPDLKPVRKLRKRFGAWLLLGIAILLFSSCSLDKNPPAVDDSFSESGLQGMDGKMLAMACSEAQTIGSIKSLLVGRNGVLVAERYYHNHGPDSLLDVKSVTKSVVSLLVGIAIDRGIIKNVNQTLGDFLRPLAEDWSLVVEPDKWSITLRDLLTMSGGFQWPAFGDWSEYNRWAAAPDQIGYVLAKPLIHPPGQIFTYNDGACHLLSVVVSLASGMSTQVFAERSLFGPLGIGRRPWAVDNRGYAKGCVALKLTSRDMWKLGLMVLQSGRFEGQNVVSSEWIHESTRSQIHTNLTVPYGSDYGYLWWISRAQSKDLYYANGYGGQFIVVVPESNLVVVATNECLYAGSRANDNWYSTISLVMNQILPAAR